MHKGAHFQIPVVSQPLSPKGIRKLREIIELHKGQQGPREEPGERAVHLPNLGGPLLAF